MKYPRSIFLIIATEFCERFSFCGLRTILSLYLRNVLLFQENEATIIYHIFIMFCYLVPVVGAILADSYLGRFRTILYFSIIYAIGNILMCLAAIPPISFRPIGMTFFGLFLIACGTGGIKPCVAAFGGDQFHLPLQEKYLQQFFSIFYFTINFGGLVGMILIPILRKAVTCFGDDTCYALGFGFPATLMIIALLFFLLGKPLYRLKYPKENIMLSFFSCILYAAKKSCKRSNNEEIQKHWLDNARDKFPAKLITDIKTVLAVLYLYIPLPFFWSLFDQQGSRWTFQASRMNGYVWGIQLLPDQMQVINPAIVLFLIPLFDKGIYPRFFKKCKLHSPLNRMIIGGIFAGLAFFASGILELKLEKTYPVLPRKGKASLNFINTLDCDVGFMVSFFPDFTLSKGEKKILNVTAKDFSSYKVYLFASPDCWDLELINPTLSTNIRTKEFQIDTFLIGIVDKQIYLFDTESDLYSKSLSGRPKLRFIFMRDSDTDNNVTVTLKNSNQFEDTFYVPGGKFLSESAYIELEPGFFQYTISGGINPSVSDQSKELALGGVYLLVIKAQHGHVVFHKLFTMTPPNEIHMLWLFPQYILISIAEIMFAISGLEFSFTQAPNSMKTVTIAAWYVSVALGNFLVIIVIQARLFQSQANEFFVFAGLILLNMLIFAAMVKRYKFVLMEANSSEELFSLYVNRDQEDYCPLIRPEKNQEFTHRYSITSSASLKSTSSTSDS